MDLSESILTQPMRRAQAGIVAICILLTMIDGFDILVMAFVAPHLARVWSLGAVEVGYLLSAGVFGMAVGAAVVSPLADKIGRRRHITVCLALITVGMLLSATANSVPQLVAYRAFAGLFIGGIVASINVIVSEYCPNRRRAAVMGVYGIGFPLGSAIGGAVTGPLIAAFGWRAPFVFGAALTLIMLAVVLLALPESIQYLIERRPKGALGQYNKIADRLGHLRATSLPQAIDRQRTAGVWKSLFAGVMLSRTTFLWLAYAGLVAAFYFANTWTPKLVADASGDPNLGIRAGVFILLGGVAGALVFAALSTIIRARLVAVLILLGGAVVFSLFAHYFSTVETALQLAVLVGVCASGGIAAFYAISPSVYPTFVRGTGVGLMIGFGRGVAILAPIFTGYVLKAGWTPQTTYQFFAAVMAFAGVATLLLDRTYHARSTELDADMVEGRTRPA